MKHVGYGSTHFLKLTRQREANSYRTANESNSYASASAET